MKKSKIRIILPFAFVFFMGCALQNQHGPKTHIAPEQKKYSQYYSQYIDALPQNLSPNRRIIVHSAIENLGQPYTWGGQSPTIGFDCSGLVSFTHGKAGIQVPRTTKEQFEKGRPVSRKSLAPGDLVFFNTLEKKKGSHVGIFIGKGQFIHAPGRGRHVCLASLNNHYFSHHFKGARSYLLDAPKRR